MGESEKQEILKISNEIKMQSIIDKYFKEIYFGFIFDTKDVDYRDNLFKFTRNLLTYFAKKLVDPKLFNLFILKKSKDHKIVDKMIIEKAKVSGLKKLNNP